MKLDYYEEENSRYPAFYLKGKKILFLDRRYKSSELYEQICMITQVKNSFYIGTILKGADHIKISEHQLISFQYITKEAFPEYFL